MKKNYLSPTLRVMRVSTTSVLATSPTQTLAKPGEPNVIDMSTNAEDVGWSKSFWGVTEDDSPASGDN